MGGTYADENPDASVGERFVNSIKKTVSDVAQLAAPHSVTDAKARVDAATSDSDTPSNTGPTGQSTDAWNKY